MALPPDIIVPRPGRKYGRAVTTSTNLVPAVSGTLYYELMVFWYSAVDEKTMRKYNDKVFMQINKNFGLYMDAKSRALPSKYHHVYEWNQVGKKEGRLWKIVKSSDGTNSISMRYQFFTSKRVAPINPILATPGPTGKVVKRSAVFKNKAFIMEEGLPVVIKRKKSDWLAIPNIYKFSRKSPVIFVKGPVTVRNPGGTGVKFSFAKSFSGYFSSGLATKDLQRGKVLDTPARITKKVGQDVPSAIYKVGVSRGVEKDFIKKIAEARVAAEAEREYNG